jgi:outer membrane protein OmpA-like peptidoglycan-associated protein
VAPYGLEACAQTHRRRLDKGRGASTSFNKRPNSGSFNKGALTPPPRAKLLGKPVSATAARRHSKDGGGSNHHSSGSGEVGKPSAVGGRGAAIEAEAPDAALGLCNLCASSGHGVLASARRRTLAFNQPLKFGGRQATVHAASSPTLALLARLLTDNPLPVQVEGHTNNAAAVDHVPFLDAVEASVAHVALDQAEGSAATAGSGSAGDDGDDDEDEDDGIVRSFPSAAAAASRGQPLPARRQWTPHQLSQRRADAVCRDLLAAARQAASLPEARRDDEAVDLATFLFPVGVGGQRLLTRHARPAAAHAQRNRRVEVHFLDLA